MKNNLLKVFTVLFAASMMVCNAAWGKTIYLDVSGPTADNPWSRENAYFQILGNGDGNNWIHMNRVPNSTCIYEAECNYTNIRFERRSPNWEYHWNYSVQGNIPSDKNLFIITGWNDSGDTWNGVWSTYTPCTNEMPSTFYYLAGEGVGSMPVWNASGLTMLWDCDKKVFYYTFKDLDANTTKYQFKLNPSTDTSWGHEINANNIDNNYKDYANLELFSIQDSRITFSLSEKSDVTLYTDGNKVWASTPTSPTPVLTGTYYLKGDMWLQSSGNGWIEAGDGQTPKLVVNEDKTEAIGYYVIPKSMFQRIEFKLDGTADASTIAKLQNDGGYAFNTNSSKAEINKDDSKARKVTLVYKASDGILHASAAQPNQKSGWTLAYRKTGVSTWTEVAMDDQGEKTLESLESGQKYYIKITDGTSGIHGVNWFGGMYIDIDQSKKVSFNTKNTYYKNGDFQWPINSQNDPVGVFYPQESKITVAFDGGVITFKEATTPTPIEDPVTITFNSNYGSAVAEQVIEKGSKATKPTAPTKSENEFKGWYQNADFSGEQFNFDNTTIEEDITLYAKWNYNGTTYMVNGSNLGITPWNDQDWDKNMETMPEMTNVGDHLEYEVQVAFLKSNDIRFKLLPCRTHFAVSPDCWNNCRSWDNYFSVERSSNLATYEREGDNNIQFNLTGEGAYGITICFDGVNVYSKIEPLTLYTVTFMNGTSEFATQQVAAGYNPTKPTPDPEKAGYTFLGWSETEGGDVVDVTTITILDAKTFYAKWELKTVETVVINPTTLKLVENGATGTVSVVSFTPEDAQGTTIAWTSDNEGVATVVDGVVTPVSKGTTTITCTVSNTAGSASATCAVTVISEDEDCEIVWKEQYKGVGEIVNPFVPGGQGGPDMLTKCKIQVGKDNGNKVAYYDENDANGYIKHGNGDTDNYWWYVDTVARKVSYATDGYTYYLRNVANGKYLCMSDVVIGTGNWGSNYTITADKTESNEAKCTWFFKQSNDKRLVNLSTKKNDNTGYEKGEMFIHRYQGVSSPAGTYAVTGSSDGNQGNWQLTVLFTNVTLVDNPDAKQPTVEKDGKTYYRFAENGAMVCTLDNALKVGDSISVYCYNTTGTTVSGELRIGGAKVADINLAAGVSVFPYIVAAAGGTEVVVATSSSDFCVAGVEVDRQGPDVPKPANLAWDADLSGGVNRMVSEGAFQHVATAKGAGVITYSSSDEAVATVAADGTVTPVDAGTTTITATLEQEGCFEEGTISYTLNLTDLPKPVITFNTLPSDAPQGSVQTVEVTTTGGDNFALAITDGTGATLTIVENTGTKITATLAFGADATDIELTATTDRKEGEWAAASAVATATVSACYTEGVDIFTFTMQGSAAAANQPAIGIVGGSVTQNELGTVGTPDNPATLDVLKIKMNGNKYVYDNAGKVEVKDNEGGDECKWAMIPTGDSYKPNWSSDTYTLYYLKNVSTNKYMKRGAGQYGNNGDWKYYTTVTDATLGEGDEYKWFIALNSNNKFIVNKAGVRDGGINKSDHLHDCNQYNDVTDQYAKKPAVPCGMTSDLNDYSKLSLTTSTMPNPDMIKSVTIGEKTYYIISSTGQITINCEMEVGDKIHLDVYDRQLAVAYEDEVIVDANKSQYVYTTDNEYLCIAGISIWRQKAGEFITPTLQWDADLTEAQEVEPGEVLTHTATGLPKTVAIMGYQSSDDNVATVDANGEVTIATDAADGATATITATLPAIGCYEEATASYTIKVVIPAPVVLQDAIDATPADETLTLTIDYIGQDGVINKAITIKGENKEVGTLTVTESGSLTVGSAINMNEFTLWEAEGNAATPATSAQIIGAEQLNISGDTWFNVTFEPGANIDFGWYTLAVPFTVDNANGVYYINAEGSRTHATCGSDYMIYNYNSSKRAQGQNGWEKYYGNLQPGVLYLITLNDDLQVSTFSFKQADGNLGGNAELALNAYPSSDPINANWNGVGNSTLVYRNVSFSGDKVQVYNHAADAFQVYPTSDVSFVVGGAFFVQSEGAETLTLTETANPGLLRTPIRERAATMAELNVRIGADENSFTDQIFLSAEDDAEESYEIGHDLVKMSHNTPKVAQLAINAYGVALCDAELPWNASNEAVFPLTITAPKAGTYTIYLNGTAQSALLLYQNGHYVCDLTASAYTMDLGKGKNNEYSLVMTRPNETVITGNEDVQQALNVKKIILDNQMYILKDNQMINAIGTIVK